MRTLVRLLIALLLTAAAGLARADVPRKRALLIGISRHAKTSGGNQWPDLHCHLDVENLKQLLLARWGFAEQDVQILENEQATRVGILKAVRNHLIAPCGPGDVLFFYFSGNGQQIRDDSVPTGVTQSLVPFDAISMRASDGAKTNVRMTELAELLVEMQKKGASNIFAGLDSCHSGGFGADVQGQLQVIKRRESPARAEGAMQHLVVASAAGANESAFEQEDERNRPIGGAFTVALTRALSRGGARTSYRDIAEQVQADVTRALPQHPEFVGDVDRVVFSGIPVPLPAQRYLLGSVDRAKLLLFAGSLHGVTAGSRYAIYRPGAVDFSADEKLGEAQVVRVEATFSLLQSAAQAELAGRPECHNALRLVETAHDWGDARLKVRVDLDGSPLAGPLMQVLVGLRFAVQVKDGAYDVRIRRSAGGGMPAELVIEGSDGNVLASLPEPGLSSASLRPLLERMLRFGQFSNLKHADPQPIAIEMRLIPVEVVRDPTTGKESFRDRPEPRRGSGGVLLFKEGEYAAIELKNVGKSKAFVNILDLRSDATASVLWPTPQMVSTATALSAGEERRLPFVFKLEGPYGVQRLKAIVCTTPVDLRSSVQVGSEAVPPQNPLDAGARRVDGQHRGAGVEQEADAVWSTAELSYRVVASRTLHVLTVGYSGNRQVVNSNEAGDAAAVEKSLRETGRFAFEEIHSRVLIDQQASPASVEEALREIKAQAGPDDTFVFYYSGPQDDPRHSATGSPEVATLPLAAPGGTTTNGLSALALRNWLSKIEASKRLVILDGCESARGFQRFASQAIDENEFLGDLIERQSMLLGLIHVGSEPVAPQRGAIHTPVAEALSGAAYGSQDGSVTAFKLGAHLSEVLPRTPGGSWRLVSAFRGEDFVLGTLKDRPQVATRGMQLVKDVDEWQQIGPKLPKSYALLVASDEYVNFRKLNNPILDAQAIKQELEEHYRFEDVRLLTNRPQEEIGTALRELRSRAGENDQIFVFFAGHGIFDEDGSGRGYVVASDSKKEERDPVRGSFIAYDWIQGVLDGCACRHVFLALDVCYGGTFDPRLQGPQQREGEKQPQELSAAYVQESLKWKSRRFLTSVGKVTASDGEAGAHSPFARGLLKALRERSRVLNVTRLLPYVEGAGGQHAICGDFGHDEPGSDFFFLLK